MAAEQVENQNRAADSATNDASHKLALEAEQENFKQVSVFGITNRQLSKDEKSFLSLDEYTDTHPQIHYYRQDIKLPQDASHSFSENVPPAQITVLTEGEFRKEIQASMQSHNGRLGVFIPGIRNAPGEAALDAAKIQQESNETFLVEDWVSSDKTLVSNSGIIRSVSDDYTSSYNSQPMINASLISLASLYGDNNLDLVAHSRGSNNLIRALAFLQRDTDFSVRSATFSHSDVDANDFSHAFPNFYRGARHLAIISDGNDLALKVSTLRRKLAAYSQGPAQSAVLNLPDGSSLEVGDTLGVVGIASPNLLSTAQKYVNTRDYFSWKQERGTGYLNHGPQDVSIARAIEESPSQAKKPEKMALGAEANGSTELCFDIKTSMGDTSPLLWRDMVSSSPEMRKEKTSLWIAQTDILKTIKKAGAPEYH